jgi:RsiW-degrading membrane proteinase PrsW (M82 family)
MATSHRAGVLKWAGVALVAGMALSALFLAGLTAGHVGERATVFGLVAATLPAPLLVAGLLVLDRLEPEPPALLALVFAWGATVAVLVATLLNRVTGDLAAGAFGSRARDAVVATVVAPLVEESVKAVALLAVVRAARHEVNGVVDGLVYAGVVGLGFAVGENVHYFAAALASGDVVLVLVVRSVFSPFAHPLFTAPFGLGLAVALTAGSRRRRMASVGAGFAVSVTVHAAWNGTFLLADAAIVAVYLLVFVPTFTAFFVLARRAGRREADLLRTHLEPEVATGTIDAGLVEEVVSPRRRRRALEEATAAGGSAARRARRSLHQALAELALARHRGAPTTAALKRVIALRGTPSA